MVKKIRNNLYGSVFKLTLVFITILVFGVTFWSIRVANTNISQAVDSLSSFYMEELVGKREVVLRDSLEKNFAQVNRVINLLENADIQDQDELRKFLSRSQTICGAKKLAIVDECSTVYTAHSTFSDASRYSFLQESFTEPRIITSNLYGAKKQVVVAVPVENIMFNGKRIVACFMQIDIDDVAGSLAYEEVNDSGNTYIGLYYKNGENLTTSSFDDIGSGQNLLSYIRTTQLAEEQSVDEIERSFRNGEQGLATIGSNGETRYIYFIPVEGTDWMLTVMVCDNTISNQLEYTSRAMLHRNIVLLISIFLIITVVFLIIGLLNRRNGEMRRKQQELEIKAKNEAELRKAYEAVASSREELAKQLDVIGGMSNAFFAVYAGHLDTMLFLSVKQSDFVHHLLEGCKRIDEAFATFIPKGIQPEDQEKMIAFTDVSTLADRLKNTDSIVIEYHSSQPGLEWCRSSWIVTSRNSEGAAERVLYVVEDISSVVQERKSNELALRLARDEAEAANKAKTDFLFNMSHDIRTPMNAIIGFAKIIENELDQPDVATTHLRKLQESSAYLLSIINNILDMARIESGNVQLNIDVVNLLDRESHVFDMFSADLRKKNLRFSHSESITHSYVYADAQKLKQINANLISNAVKYTPAGGSISVDLRELACGEPDCATFELTVSDTGIGMSPEYQKHIFESFTRERTSTENNVIGTGLGMAIVKNLVDMMGGTISVESEPGVGTTFRVVLTLRIAESQEEYLQKQTSPDTSSLKFAGKRILLAEDNELNAEIAEIILEDVGLTVERAEDGAVCVDMLLKAENGYYDLILMDIQMPNMNGYQATETIRSLPDKAKASIPIIAMTANAFEEDKQNALRAGMNGHLAKPIDIPKLMETLGCILS